MRLVEDQLAESFLKEPTKEGEHIHLDVDGGGDVLVLRQQEPPAEEAVASDADVKVAEPAAA